MGFQSVSLCSSIVPFCRGAYAGQTSLTHCQSEMAVTHVALRTMVVPSFSETRMREVPGKCSALTPQTSHFSGRKCGQGSWLSSIVPVTRCARRPSLSPPIVAIERRRVAGLKATASSRGSSCSSAARRAIGQGAGG